MRIYNEEVFNQQIVGTTAVYSIPRFNALLASAEKLVVQATIEYISGTTTKLYVLVEHCNDDINFIPKVTGTYVIDQFAFDGSSLGVAIGTDAGTVANAGFVRLKISLTAQSGTPSARVRITVCGRGEQAGASA